MNRQTGHSGVTAALILVTFGALVLAQDDPPPAASDDPPPRRAPDRAGPGGPMGFMGPMREERKVLKQFDKDEDGILNADERAEARNFLKSDAGRRGMRGPMGPRRGFGGEDAEPPKPGPRVSPDDVQRFPKESLYAPGVLRTLFFEFENEDWEAELADFYGTDVEVPARLSVDGVVYPNVGVSFRGASSYFMVPQGRKRSFNVSLDLVDSKQRLYGHKTLNLLNSHGDPTYMSTVLYSHLARPHIPAPRANFVKVVVNGESWGIYVSVEQFNKDFVAEHFKVLGKAKPGDGARWKVKGSPNGRSGLDYIGDDLAAYRQRYQIKSRDNEEDWRALVELCRVLSETPLDKLEKALAPILDIDGALWFLALDNALVNSDGYWTRASDYSLYRDPAGKFHIIPHDMNEAFRSQGGGPGPRGPGRGGFGGGPPPGGRPDDADAPPRRRRPDGGPPPDDERPMRGEGAPRPERGQRPDGPARGGRGPGGGGPELDPLIGMDDAGKPLRSRLLAVPSLRAQYLKYVREIAGQLDWKTLGPFIEANRRLLEPELRTDTRSSMPFAAFERAVAGDSSSPSVEGGQRSAPGLRGFLEQRRKYLLNYKDRSSARSAPREL